MICSMVQTDEGPAAGRAAAWRADPDMVRGYGDDASRRSASMAICEARTESTQQRYPSSSPHF